MGGGDTAGEVVPCESALVVHRYDEIRQVGKLSTMLLALKDLYCSRYRSPSELPDIFRESPLGIENNFVSLMYQSTPHVSPSCGV